MVVFQNSAACSAAVARNREPILVVLKRILPARGVVLEIASGTGEHAVHFAAGLPHLTWQPTDRDPAARQSVEEHRASAGLPNLLAALELDASARSWPVARADAVVAINMIHIAPWTAAEGLMAGSERTLPPGGVLYLYGPFREDGRHTAPSNADFDASLRARNAEWAVRDLGQVSDLARAHGLALVERVSMPANNLSLVFRSLTS
jgi:cyclopropane fatty-acyl-phospholipid synthase-like methyltransferase